MSRKISFIIVLSLFVFSVAGIPLATWNNNVAHTELNSYAFADSKAFPRGPTVHMVNKTAAMIYWETNTQTNATVNYGSTSEDLDSTVENTTLSKEHRVWIDGLDAGTTVYYQAISDGTSSDIYHFKTEPEDSTSFKLIILGDNRPSSSIAPQQPETYKDIITMIRNEEPHLVIMTGDYVFELSDVYHSKNVETMSKFLDVTDRLGHYVPIYGAIGNHDTISGSSYADYFLDAFQQTHTNSTYFSFDYAGFHFTILDTEMPGYEGRIAGAQYDWLVNDLESTDKDVKYVFGHQPLFPVSHIDSSLDRNVTERDRLQDLFERENVTVYACGHDHLFNRLTVNGVVHIISGGAGAPTYDTEWGGDYNHYVRAHVSTESMEFEAIDMDGDVVEDYNLPYEGSIEIALRRIANNTGGYPFHAPEIYFSEVPEEEYYSWDDEANSTEIGTLPDVNGLHTLDVYAKGSDGVWNHKYYEFRTVGGEEPETTTPIFPSTNLIMIIGVVAVGVIITLATVYKWKHSS